MNKQLTEISALEMSEITGGTFSWSSFFGSAAVGGLGGGVGAAATATTLSALAVPIAAGALVGVSAYLLEEAITEGFLTAETVYKYGI